ncbi:hypothetical protein Bbelb_176910 [Branchiostoma belcheri]|nr:hypothetical protein Bbelb_176910 [Branchiostoma belcheri]
MDPRILFSLLCTLMSAFAAQFMALSSQAGVPGLQLLFLMKLVQLPCILLVIPCFKPKLTAEDKQQTITLVLSGIVDNAGIIFAYMSFVFVVPGIALGVIQGSIPFFTACIGFIFLRETLGVVDCCGVLCSAAGVILVAVGMSMDAASSTQQLTVAILLPLAAAFTKGPNNVIMRLLIGVRGMPILTVALYSHVLGPVVLLPLTYALETPRWTLSAGTIAYVVGLSLCELCASLSLKLVLKMEKAGVTATLMTLVVPLTLLLDYIFQSKFPSPMKLVGVSLVLLGIAVMGAHACWVNRHEIRHRELMELLDFDD